MSSGVRPPAKGEVEREKEDIGATKVNVGPDGPGGGQVPIHTGLIDADNQFGGGRTKIIEKTHVSFITVPF